MIVQRAEVERRDGREMREMRDGREMRDTREPRGRDARGDEWADPWMRAEPAARRRRPPSSDDSYSSTRYVRLLSAIRLAIETRLDYIDDVILLSHN